MRPAIRSTRTEVRCARLATRLIGAGVALLLAAGAGAQRPARPAASAAPQAAALPSVRVLQVRPNIYMLSAGGTNVTVQIGKHGVLLVDAPPPELAPQAFAEIAKLSSDPIRYVVSTSDAREHIAGNEAIAALGHRPGGASRQSAAANPVLLGSAQGMTILAHENVLNRLTQGTGAAAVPRSVLPTSEYYQPTKDFSFNGEPIIVYHMPSAHSDGDSVVLFRNSDVMSTGDVFTPDRFPNIDRARGGSVQGLIDALNALLAITVPEAFQEGGTKVIPGHGRSARKSTWSSIATWCDRHGSDPRPDREGFDARAGAGSSADARLRPRVSLARGDAEHVRRSGLLEPRQPGSSAASNAE